MVSRKIVGLLLLSALFLAVQAQMYYDCPSSCTEVNCLHFTGSEIGATSTESFTWYNRTATLTLSNWVLKTGSSNAYRCFNYAATEGQLVCLEIQTSNGIVHLNSPGATGQSGQYCAPTTVKGRKTTQHTISRVSSRLAICPLLAPVLTSNQDSVCTANTAVSLSVAVDSIGVTYLWKLNGVTVATAGSTYSTPSGLPSGPHLVSVTVSNTCAESVTVSKTITVVQGPSLVLTSSENLDSGSVNAGTDLTLSWGSAGASGATFELFHDNVVIETLSGLTGSFLIENISLGDYKVKVTGTSASTGCSATKELTFGVIDPTSNPIITVLYDPPLINGNTAHKNCIYCIYWTATNVGPLDQLYYNIDGNVGSYYPQGWPPKLWPWWAGNTVTVNFTITNQQGQTGVLTQVLNTSTDPAYVCPAVCPIYF